MPVPHTYRFRLGAHVALLLAFLVAVLAFTYRSSSDLILHEAEKNVQHVVNHIEGQIRREKRELRDYVRMIRKNVQVNEYLFVVVSVDAEIEALRKMYERQFGWLPVDRVALVSKSGKALLGVEHADLVDILRRLELTKGPIEHQFYINGRNGLEMIAMADVTYRGETLGAIVVTTAIGGEWMEATRELSGGHLFMAADGKVVLSTVANGRQVGIGFNPEAGELNIAGEDYILRQIPLDGAGKDLPTIWLALSKMELTRSLDAQRNRVLALVVIGGAGILIIGFMLLRNFNAPLGRLVGMIREVGEGRFPEFHEVDARDEIGYLWNQFVNMVRRLRDNQHEIRKVQQQLERQAITDSLTGLYNRRYLYELFPKLYSDMRRQGSKFAIIITDLDRFKLINDEHGHIVGDEALLYFSDILRDCCRLSDFVFRIGGEEFLLLVSGDIDGAKSLAEKIRSALEIKPFRYGEHSIMMTASFGVAQVDAVNGEEALRVAVNRADIALYRAKRLGRNRVEDGDTNLRLA